jgi:ferric-dicitrate binding protein FerR (iron transport regulator)
MKIEDPRVTDYAVGELQGSAREAFEKELAHSSELQRELDDTLNLCQKLGGLPLANEGFDEAAREELRAECLRNLHVVKRERIFRRAAIVAALGAAACLLFAPLIVRTPVIQRPTKG